MAGKPLAIILVLCLLSIGSVFAAGQPPLVLSNKCEDANKLNLLSYDDFKILSNHSNYGTEMLNKYTRTMGSIYCNHVTKSTRPLKTDTGLNRKYFRVTQWNIERGFSINDIKLIYKNNNNYLKKHTVLTDEDKVKVAEDINILKDTDIFVLNEVDIGMQRTEYKNIAKEMADIINGSYAFAPEFLEVDQFYLNDPGLDRLKLRALHGNAIVSKYPIKSIGFIRLPVCYDWFKQERERLSPVEQIRRTSSKNIVQEEILTEVRQGSRVALFANIEVPGAQPITVINVHLENRTVPKCRVQQMDTILAHIKHIKTPVIMAGDFNNFEKSAEPTSVSKMIKRTVSDPQNLARAAITYFNPYALATNIASFTVGGVRKYKDPTVTNIPVILPNRAKALFDRIENFEFDDGAKFDFSGKKKLSYNSIDGDLSNSNQRASKGFVETFKFNRAYGVALYKVDWIFAKPVQKPGVKKQDFEDLKPDDKTYFPAFGKTLKDLNFSPKEGSLSDHNPVSCKIII